MYMKIDEKHIQRIFNNIDRHNSDYNGLKEFLVVAEKH
jgi:hypothetical protein